MSSARRAQSGEKREEAAHRRLVGRALREGSAALYADPRFYARLYARRHEDVAFYVETARRLGGPVLELGVGSGRVGLELAAAGVEVVGVDMSAAMLSAARRALAGLPAPLRGRLQLLRGDMRRLRLKRRFALVIAPFNTFSHLYSLQDVRDALQTCRRHLRPGGRLVFDVMMPDLRALLQDPERLYKCGRIRHPGDGRAYTLYEASHYEPRTQIRTVTMLLQPIDGNGPAQVIPLTQRQYFPAELDVLLATGGFEELARFGDFERGPLTPASETQVIVARMRQRTR